MSYEDYYRGYEVGQRAGYDQAQQEFSKLLNYYKQQVEFLHKALIELKTREIYNDIVFVLPADDTKKNS